MEKVIGDNPDYHDAITQERALNLFTSNADGVGYGCSDEHGRWWKTVYDVMYDCIVYVLLRLGWLDRRHVSPYIIIYMTALIRYSIRWRWIYDND